MTHKKKSRVQDFTHDEAVKRAEKCFTIIDAVVSELQQAYREGMSTPTKIAKFIEDIVTSALSDEREEAEGWKALYLSLRLELDVEIVKKRTAEHNFKNLKASIPNPCYSQAEVDRIVAAKMAQLQAKDGG